MEITRIDEPYQFSPPAYVSFLVRARSLATKVYTRLRTTGLAPLSRAKAVLAAFHVVGAVGLKSLGAARIRVCLWQAHVPRLAAFAGVSRAAFLPDALTTLSNVRRLPALDVVGSRSIPRVVEARTRAFRDGQAGLWHLYGATPYGRLAAVRKADVPKDGVLEPHVRKLHRQSPPV